MRWTPLLTAAAAGALLLQFHPSPAPARADEIPEKYRKTVEKGLDWLAKQQQENGSWTVQGGQYPIAITALAGMALLMEGSTIREGKYAKEIKKAADYLMDKSQKGGDRNGLIGDPNIPNEAARYMYGHGFATLFLASVYGDEQNPQQRARLKEVLTRAVKYTLNAQTSKGAWYYTSKADGRDQDEGSVTITQVQALRACRNAGIPVPREAIKKVYEYLKSCTSPRGAVYYSFTSKSERSAITAAAIACLFNAGEYKDELAKKWFKFCQSAIPPQLSNRIGHDEYTHYYYAQCVYILGEDGWDKLFGPGSPASERLTWSGYRANLFDQLLRTQNADGSWTGGGGFGSVGPVYTTAMYLTIMQLDRAALPIYQR
jgi:hypothetical protein